jgi:non-ribosomal peptide synthetase component F
VRFLGRVTQSGELAARAGALAAGLQSREEPTRRIAIFMPNCPAALVALAAGLTAGGKVLLLDPRADTEAAISRFRPELIVTLDLAALLDRVLKTLPACPKAEVAVGRFADLLPFPRNLLLPLLRGGGLANLPPDPRFFRLSDFERGAASEPARRSGEIFLPSSETPLDAAELSRLSAKILPARPGERWLLAGPLSNPAALAATYAGLARGAEVVLSPRLDEASLDALSRRVRIGRRVP